VWGRRWQTLSRLRSRTFRGGSLKSAIKCGRGWISRELSLPLPSPPTDISSTQIPFSKGDPARAINVPRATDLESPPLIRACPKCFSDRVSNRLWPQSEPCRIFKKTVTNCDCGPCPKVCWGRLENDWQTRSPVQSIACRTPRGSVGAASCSKYGFRARNLLKGQGPQRGIVCSWGKP
jgi:hypothetical protein